MNNCLVNFIEISVGDLLHMCISDPLLSWYFKHVGEKPKNSLHTERLDDPKAPEISAALIRGESDNLIMPKTNQRI